MIRLRIDPRHHADVQLALGFVFPAVAGLALFGWRCLGVWALVAAGAFAGRFVLSRLRTWTATPAALPLLVRCAVVGLFCPATLFDLDLSTLRPDARWPALVAIGGGLATLDWARRQTRGRRFDAGVLTIALLTLGLPAVVRTDRVLTPQALVVGDLLSTRISDRPDGTSEPWLDWPRGGGPTLVTPPAERPLSAFLHDRPPPDRTTQTVPRLLSDDLPPLEDLVLGGHPSAIGGGSLVLVLVGGLFLVYRGLTPLRVPAVALLACYAGLVVLPLPTGGGVRRCVFERDAHVGWAAGLTLVHYLFVASPIALTTTFLLPQPGVRPGGRWRRRRSRPRSARRPRRRRCSSA